MENRNEQKQRLIELAQESDILFLLEFYNFVEGSDKESVKNLISMNNIVVYEGHPIELEDLYFDIKISLMEKYNIVVPD